MNWYKKAQNGEWWIVDGSALFADADIGAAWSCLAYETLACYRVIYLAVAVVIDAIADFYAWCYGADARAPYSALASLSTVPAPADIGATACCLASSAS